MYEKRRESNSRKSRRMDIEKWKKSKTLQNILRKKAEKEIKKNPIDGTKEEQYQQFMKITRIGRCRSRKI